MFDLSEKANELYSEVNRNAENGQKEYLIVSNFGNTSLKSEVEPEAPMFRIFTPVKAEKGRKLNSIYGFAFNIYKDSLMDYPTIIQYKLGKTDKANWEAYNRLVSLQVSGCPLECWHCYLEECLSNDCSSCGMMGYCDQTRKNGIKKEFKSASSIVESFKNKREADSKRGLSSNVLRITGGEPFIVSDLLIEILEELREKKLDEEIFVWTETNLIPLIEETGKASLVKDETLNKLASLRTSVSIHVFMG